MKKFLKITKFRILLFMIILWAVWADYRYVNIPVLFYHRINNIDDPAEGLSIPPEAFENQLSWLSRNGYTTISCTQLESYYNGTGQLPEKPVMITFDDGYADNYIYAYPLLKKYGMKAVIFVETSRIGNLPEKRTASSPVTPYEKANYEAAQALLAGLPSAHFVSWEECREMTESGLIEIASHSHYHKEIFTSNEPDGFYTSFDHWSTILATDGDERKGIPLYKRTSSMTARKFTDNPQIRDIMAETFLQTHGDMIKLKEKYSELCKKFSPGEFESDQEHQKRISYEFSQSASLIAQNCGPTQAFCWPWGKYSEESEKIGRENGYSLFFTTRIGTNTLSDSTGDICRFKIFSTSKYWFASRMLLHSHYALIKPYALLHNFSRGGYK